MHILMATDGHLDPAKAADLMARIHRSGDQVTVLTAVDHPREFLGGFAKVAGVEELAHFAHEAGPGMIGMASGAKAAERLADRQSRASGGSKAPEPVRALEKYFATTAQRRVAAMLQHLEEKGIEAAAAWSPTENQTAATILEYVESRGVDLLVVGDRGRSRIEDGLGSTVTKLVRRATVPVVVVK